jgi:protease-4
MEQLSMRWQLAAVVLCAGLSLAPLCRAEDKVPAKDTATIAHIKLGGGLDETPTSGEPLFGSGNENFKSKLDRLKKAKTDPKVKGVYLQIDGLGIGYGKQDELRRAIADVRAAGKKVFAFFESADTKDYLVAAAADVVAMPESGEINLVGVRAEVSFYKDMFEKLHIKADMLQMGDFKGAAEPYIRSSMSPQLRKQFETVIDDYFEESIIQTLVTSRPAQKWRHAQVKKLIDEGPYLAKRALAAGLVDQLAYADQFEQAFAKSLKVDSVKVVRNYGAGKKEDIDLSSPFAMFKLLASPKSVKSDKPKIAVIYAVGAIVSGSGGGSLMGGEQVGSTTMVEAIHQAEKDDTVKAIVLRVDSPGGSALASDLIWDALRKSKKPVIASMGDTAASGGYYISMAAKKIYAEPGTLTGSIGVVGGKIVTGGLFDMVGIKTDTITRGANAGINSPSTPFTDSERAAYLVVMREIYDQFLDKALLGRQKAGVKMTREQLVNLAGGRIWTGRQAKDAGLIDELGTLDDAIAAAKGMTDLAKDVEPELLILPKSKSFLDKLLDSKNETRALPLQQIEALRAVPGGAKHLQMAEQLLQLSRERAWLMMPYRIDLR